MRGLIGFAIYLGMGAMMHALFVGPTFDWSSAWTFGWLLGWPLMLMISLWAVAAGIGVAAIVCVVGWSWLKAIAEWRESRAKARRRA